MARSNPRRPPKKWMRDCIKGVKRSKKKVRDPGAVCGAQWYRKTSPKAKRAALRRERKKNPCPACAATPTWMRVFG